MPPVAIGIALIVITVALHAVTTSVLVYLFGHVKIQIHPLIPMRRKAFLLGLTTSLLAIKHCIDMVLWAAAYWHLAKQDVFEDFHTAIYFSSVTYTTLGYGDIVPTGEWRVLCGIQAMNGILLFGWSTALLIMLVQTVYFRAPAPDD